MGIPIFVALIPTDHDNVDVLSAALDASVAIGSLLIFFWYVHRAIISRDYL